MLVEVVRSYSGPQLAVAGFVLLVTTDYTAFQRKGELKAVIVGLTGSFAPSGVKWAEPAVRINSAAGSRRYAEIRLDFAT